jgi:hypothetical protein
VLLHAAAFFGLLVFSVLYWVAFLWAIKNRPKPVF